MVPYLDFVGDIGRCYFAGHINSNKSPFPRSTHRLNSQCQTAPTCPGFFKPPFTSLLLPSMITVSMSCLRWCGTLWFWAQLIFVVFLLKCLLMRPGLILTWHQFYAVTHLSLNLLSFLSAEPWDPPGCTQDLNSISSDFNSYHHGFKPACDGWNHWSWKTKEIDKTSLKQNG